MSYQFKTIFLQEMQYTEAVNREARLAITPMRLGKLEGFTLEDCEKIRWKGLIEHCIRCGGRAYRHGWCFNCGKPY